GCVVTLRCSGSWQFKTNAGLLSLKGGEQNEERQEEEDNVNHWRHLYGRGCLAASDKGHSTSLRLETASETISYDFPFITDTCRSIKPLRYVYMAWVGIATMSPAAVVMRASAIPILRTAGSVSP